jgi:dTDP-4-dehydrorhamnose reductase
MEKLLITGASGLLGSNLVFAVADYYAVTAITNQHHLRHHSVDVLATDLTKTGVALEIMRAVQPEVVVHAAAEANVDRCEQDEQWAYLHNRDMAYEVAAAARSTGAYLIHISTDAVFDGRRDHHVESDNLTPVNIYSRSKAAGETVVQEAHPEAAIVRTNFYGWNMLDKFSLAEWFLDHLEQGQACCGFDDVWITPLLVNDLVSYLLRMMEMKHSGIYHLGGADCVSKYQFGRLLATVGGFNPDLIRPGSVNEAGLKAPRPLKLCLDSSKICRALGIETPSFIAGIKRFLALRTEGYVDSLKAMSQ